MTEWTSIGRPNSTWNGAAPPFVSTVDTIISAADYDTMADILTAVGADNRTVYINKDITISSTTTLSTSMSTIGVQGAMFHKVGTGKLVINGPFSAGLYQVFSGFSAGDVTGLKEAYTEWWGTPTGTGEALFDIAVASGATKVHSGVGIRFPGRFTATENITEHAHYGFLDVSQINYSADQTPPEAIGHASYSASTEMFGTISSSHHHDFQSSSEFRGSGILSAMRGFYSKMSTTSTGTVTDLMGVGVYDAGGTGAISTQYGVFVGYLTRGGINYAVYVQGDGSNGAQSYFGGKVGIGITPTTPTHQLDVAGNIASRNRTIQTDYTLLSSDGLYGYGTTDLTIDAPTGKVVLLKINGAEKVRVTPTGLRVSLPVYANNAAAIAGGLVAGDLYRTGGDPDLVSVVH